MNTVVCLKYDTALVQGKAEEENQLSPADEAALEWAIKLSHGGTVTAVSMGPSKLERNLHFLAGLGVDRMILVSDTRLSGSDSYVTAHVLSRVVDYIGDCDLILCGRKGMGGETGQVPVELAAMLSRPCVTNVTGIRASASPAADSPAAALPTIATQASIEITCDRLLAGGISTLTGQAPMVITCCEYSAKLRRPRVSLMQKAAEKQTEILTIDDLGLDETVCGVQGSVTKVCKTTPIERGRHVTWLEDVSALKEILERGEFNPNSGTSVPPAETIDQSAETTDPLEKTIDSSAKRIESPVETIDPSADRLLVLCGSYSAQSAALIKRAGKLSRDLRCETEVICLPECGADELALAEELAQWIRTQSVSYILSDADIRMKTIMAGIAGNLGAGLTADCTDLYVDDLGRLVQVRPTYGDSLEAQIISRSVPGMATVCAGALPEFTEVRDAYNAEFEGVKIREWKLPASGRLHETKFQKSESETQLTNAQVIITGGLGIGSRENFKILEQLAQKYHTGLGATRAAVAAGYAPYSCQIGQTGVAVQPRVYLAFGVSGASQHLAGMSRSETVIAVNTDPRAPIFRFADLGIVGDWRNIAEALLG